MVLSFEIYYDLLAIVFVLFIIYGCFFRYGLYVGIIFIIMYGDKSQDAYLEKSALETAIIHGGTNCDVLPDDDPNFKACDPDDVPDAWINFMKVQYQFYISRKPIKLRFVILLNLVFATLI